MSDDATIVFGVRMGDRHALALVAKRAYRFGRGRLEPLPQSPRVLLAPASAPSGNPDALDRMVCDSDLCAPLKPFTDVLLSGSAYSRRLVRAIDTVVKVGPLRKAVRAWGDRTLELGPAGTPCFSEADFIDSVPLSWDRAYGGRDAYAEEKLRPRTKIFARPSEELPGAIAYPRNPSGRGFFLDVDRERIVGTTAPNLEEPEDPVTPDRLLAESPEDWLDRPVAACYEPVDWLSFPRLLWWLGAEHVAPKRPVHEVRKGVLSPDNLQGRKLGGAPDPRAYNCAPVGLSGVRLQGNERVSLWNLHPRQEAVEFDLPAEAPRLLLEPPGCRIYELPARLATVLIEPAEERVTLSWAGSMEVAGPYSREACEEMRNAVRWER